MAGELKAIYATGQTLYAIEENAAGLVYNGSAFEAMVDLNWANYGVTLTEQGTSGFYLGNARSVATQRYQVRRRVGGSNAASDPVIWEDLTAAGIADALLVRRFADVTTPAETDRCALQALRRARNLVENSNNIQTIYREDDTTADWSLTLSGSGTTLPTRMDPN